MNKGKFKLKKKHFTPLFLNLSRGLFVDEHNSASGTPLSNLSEKKSKIAMGVIIYNLMLHGEHIPTISRNDKNELIMDFTIVPSKEHQFSFDKVSVIHRARLAQRTQDKPDVLDARRRSSPVTARLVKLLRPIGGMNSLHIFDLAIQCLPLIGERDNAFRILDDAIYIMK